MLLRVYPVRHIPIVVVASCAIVVGSGCSVYAQADWMLKEPTGPSARIWHALAFDSGRNRAVLFGGKDLNNVWGDTWEWDGTTWTLASTSGPSPRYGHAMVYDSARGVTVLVAGYDGPEPVLSVPALKDTWEWDGATWTQRASMPTAVDRCFHAMMYDSVRNVTVLYGGYSRTSPGVFGDTWEWDGGSWSQRPVSGPGPRKYHAMAFDVDRAVGVLFGGSDGGQMLITTWEWNGNAWTQPGGIGTPASWFPAMGYDPARRSTVLFGGQIADGNTWEWRGGGWTLWASCGPSGRFGHAMVRDTARNTLLLFGGYSGGGTPMGAYSAQTWELAGSQCYANCDHSSADPILNVMDFACFLNQFAAGNCIANCDGSTAPPFLNVQDFACFLNSFAAGCS